VCSKKRRAQHQENPETPESVEAWARDLIAAISKRQARAVLDDFLRLAADTQLSALDRAIARQRAKILSDFLSQNLGRSSRVK
jgi:hypothetical protein